MNEIGVTDIEVGSALPGRWRLALLRRLGVLQLIRVAVAGLRVEAGKSAAAVRVELRAESDRLGTLLSDLRGGALELRIPCEGCGNVVDVRHPSVIKFRLASGEVLRQAAACPRCWPKLENKLVKSALGEGGA